MNESERVDNDPGNEGIRRINKEEISLSDFLLCLFLPAATFTCSSQPQSLGQCPEMSAIKLADKMKLNSYWHVGVGEKIDTA